MMSELSRQKHGPTSFFTTSQVKGMVFSKEQSPYRIQLLRKTHPKHRACWGVRRGTRQYGGTKKEGVREEAALPPTPEGPGSASMLDGRPQRGRTKETS